MEVEYNLCYTSVSRYVFMLSTLALPYLSLQRRRRKQLGFIRGFWQLQNSKSRGPRLGGFLELLEVGVSLVLSGTVNSSAGHGCQSREHRRKGGGRRRGHLVFCDAFSSLAVGVG